MTDSHFYDISENERGELLLRFKGRMDMDNAAAILEEVEYLIYQRSPAALTADLASVAYFDDFGALVLFEMRRMVTDRNGVFRIANSNEKAEAILSRTDSENNGTSSPPRKKRSYNMFVHLGESVMAEVSDIRFTISFAGALLLAFGRACMNPRLLRGEDTLNHMEKTGVDALPVVALISFLLGLIMAFMSSIQFQQFGAGIYVASLVAFAMVSELGPIMTAIVVAGRSGSAFAAEIGTMKISEEIDALTIMGFDPVLFLGVPRLVAALIVVPLLALFSNLFAIAGGLMVGVFMLDLTPGTYIGQTLEVLTLTEVLWGMGKSGVFASLIAWVGCLRGFQASGGASAVGGAATSAVVSGIFLIILFDSIFAVIRSYW